MAAGARRFTCPYHGWVYDTAGKNVNIKDHATGAYPPAFEAQSHDLTAIPKLESYRGFVFASLAADGELAGTVENIVYIGTDTLYLLKVAGQSGFRVRQQNHDGAQLRCVAGDQVRIKVPASAIRVLAE